MPFPKIKLSDDSGNEVGVTSNRLNVNAYLAATPTIDIGDVSLLLDGTAADYGTGNVNTSGRTLRVTLASDDPSVALLTTIDADTSAISGNTNLIKLNSSSLVSIIGTFGTTTYTEGSTSGYVFGGVRNDTLASLADTDNEIAPLQVNENGALYVTSGADHNASVVDNGIGIMAEAKSIDGSALPNTTAEGDAIRVAATRGGVLYSCLISGDGLKSPVIDDDDGQVATPAMVNVGGEYRSSDTTYADGDATILQTNVNGLLRVDGSDVTQPISGTVTANLGTTDNAVLDAMVVDLAAMEALLITIDSDTDAIKTAVQILDDWDDSDYANVNINLAGTDAPTGGGAESGALRVTLANDSTGVISIDDGGNTITVDGTVDLGSTATTHLSEIEGAVETIEGAISGSEMQVDVVAALPAGTNAIGKVGHDITGMVSGSNTDVGTSAEILRALGNVACKRVDVIASSANTGVIWVGGSNLTADAGIPLSPGDFYSVDVDGTSDIYVLAAVNGEDVYFNYYT